MILDNLSHPWIKKGNRKETLRQAGRCNTVSLIISTDQNLSRQSHSSEPRGNENVAEGGGKGKTNRTGAEMITSVDEDYVI